MDRFPPPLPGWHPHRILPQPDPTCIRDEVAPDPDKDLSLPVHQIFLAVNGVHTLENLELDELVRKKIDEFAFTLQPLKIQCASGSTVALAAIR
jgi:kynurenine formamidase